MATAPQARPSPQKSEKFPEIHCWLRLAPPAIETRALSAFIDRSGNTIEKIRALIAVLPAIEAVQRAYAARGRSERSALEFRRRVGEEFERLVEIS